MSVKLLFFKSCLMLRNMTPPFLLLFSLSCILLSTICLVSWIPRILVLCSPLGGDLYGIGRKRVGSASGTKLVYPYPPEMFMTPSLKSLCKPSMFLLYANNFYFHILNFKCHITLFCIKGECS